MVAGAAAFVSDTQKLQKAPDIGLGVALLGDALTVLGSGVSTIPGGQVPGAVASAISGLITAGGKRVSTFIKHKEFTDEQRKYLAAAGAGSLTEAFMNTSGSRVKELTEPLGLSPEQV